jgi:hypothetical protein
LNRSSHLTENIGFRQYTNSLRADPVLEASAKDQASNLPSQ